MLIYKITNNLNGKIYIGLYTKSLTSFKNYWGSGVIISKAIKKYGKLNFSKIILEDNIQIVESLFEKEKYYISKYNSTHPSIGYNISEGGQGHFSKHSDTTKNILSLKTKARFSNPTNHPRSGVKLTPDVKDKIRNGNKENRLKKNTKV